MTTMEYVVIFWLFFGLGVARAIGGRRLRRRPDVVVRVSHRIDIQ